MCGHCMLNTLKQVCVLRPALLSVLHPILHLVLHPVLLPEPALTSMLGCLTRQNSRCSESPPRSHLPSIFSTCLLCRRQDDTLDDIEQAVSRIGQLGRSIGEELDGQVRRDCAGRGIVRVRGDCAGWGIVRRKL